MIDFFTCSICGEHIGAGFNHDECAKVKKEIYKSHKRKKARRKLTDDDLKRYEQHISKIR